MQFSIRLFLLLLCLASSWLTGQQTIQVASDGKTFPCRLQPLAEPVHGCQGYLFTFPSAVRSSRHPQNDTVSGELYRPLRPVPGRSAPAVVVYHIIGPGLFVLERAQCRNLARHGVTALFFHLPFYGPRSAGRGPEAMLQSPQLFTSCLEQAISDSRRAVDLLLHFPDVSPRKLGAAGISLGSLMTANAVATDSRITKAMMILGGGNLRQIIAGKVYETQAIRQFLASLKPDQRAAMLSRLDRYDPLNCSPALKRLSRFVMLNADHDHIIPPETSRQLARCVGTRIHWYRNLNHYTAMGQFKDMLERQVDLFGNGVPETWKPPQDPPPAALALASQTARTVLDFTGAMPPRSGRAHVIQGCLKVDLLGTLAIPLTCRLALGPQHQFRAANPAFAAGMDLRHLWLLDGKSLAQLDRTRLKGQHLFSNSLVEENPFKLFQAALALLAEAPDCLSPYVSCNAKTAQDGFQTLEMISLMPDVPATVYVTFNRKGQPKNLAVHMNGLSFSLEIHQLVLNKKVPDAFFSSPQDRMPIPLATHDSFHTVISRIFPFFLPPQQN